MGHGHGHHDDHAALSRVVPRQVRRRITLIAIALGVATAIGLFLLWPRHDFTADVAKFGVAKDQHEATVTRIGRGPCGGIEGGTTRVLCDRVQFQLTGGPDRGERRSIEFADAPNKPTFDVGDKVILAHTPGQARPFDYTYADVQRRSTLFWLAAIFAAAVILLGRWRGVGALVGLGASIFIVLAFIVPSMLSGNSPPVVAIVGASAIAFLALYLAGGFTTMTTVALLATLGALGITVALATAFTELAQFSGAVDEDALLLKFGAANIDLKGLVLAGMVLGTLGALDDVTVTQASAVAEVRAHNEHATRRELYASGLRVGRDHVASTVNTLALAYAGAALPVLILFSISSRSLGAVANGEIIATEIVSALVGSIGLVCAVPIATALAALVATGPARRRPPPPRRTRRPLREPAPVEHVLEPRDPDTFWSSK